MFRIPFRILGFIGLGIVLAGCLPKPIRVTKFDVEPKHVCHDTEVVISWDTQGAESVELSSDPSVSPRLGSVELNGTTTRRVEETTKFTVEASNGTKIDRKNETVEVVPPGGEDGLYGTSGRCVGGIPRWVLTVPSNVYDENLRVRDVWNQSGREIYVSHAGQHFTFPRFGGHTEIFNGTKLTGDWEITPLIIEPSEACPTPSPGTGEVTAPGGVTDPVFQNLTLGIHAGCD